MKTTVLTLLGVLLLGCDDTKTSSGNPATNFSGTWKLASGMGTQTCPGAAPQSGPLQKGDLNLTITAGATASDLDIAFSLGANGGPPTCSTGWTLSGNTATMTRTMSCAIAGADGGAGGMLAFKSGTLTTTDGQTLTGTWANDLTDPMGVTCAQTTTATFGR
jgi:hypothetical protein